MKKAAPKKAKLGPKTTKFMTSKTAAVKKKKLKKIVGGFDATKALRDEAERWADVAGSLRAQLADMKAERDSLAERVLELENGAVPALSQVPPVTQESQDEPAIEEPLAGES